MLNEKKVGRMPKLQELVHLPNRVQFQIHPLSDVKVG